MDSYRYIKNPRIKSMKRLAHRTIVTLITILLLAALSMFVGGLFYVFEYHSLPSKNIIASLWSNNTLELGLYLFYRLLVFVILIFGLTSSTRLLLVVTIYFFVISIFNFGFDFRYNVAMQYFIASCTMYLISSIANRNRTKPIDIKASA